MTTIRNSDGRPAHCELKPALLGAVAAASLMISTPPARADEHMVLVDKIDVGGKGIGAFDISFVDPAIGLYVIADRTNGSIDLVDARDDTFIGRVSGFKGVVLKSDGTANNSLSGPDGVVIINHKEVWAGDGDSTVKVISLATNTITDTISTNGSFRCDEMAYDSRDHILAVANNADSPPFVTMINTDTHAVMGKLVFDKTHAGVDAQNGIEQPQWSPQTGKFYVSVPQVGSDPAQGGVAVIDPGSMSVTAVHLVQNCSPAGLAIGPDHQALIGCSASFGTAPNVVTQSQVIDIRTGEVLAFFPQVGGNDEVWYDAGTGHYYLAARSYEDSAGKVTPIMGTIDAMTLKYDGSVPTSTTAHSVAADRISHHVFVPIGFVPSTSPAGTDATNPCPSTGCIAVYLPSSIDSDDLTRVSKR